MSSVTSCASVALYPISTFAKPFHSDFVLISDTVLGLCPISLQMTVLMTSNRPIMASFAFLFAAVFRCQFPVCVPSATLLLTKIRPSSQLGRFARFEIGLPKPSHKLSASASPPDTHVPRSPLSLLCATLISTNPILQNEPFPRSRPRRCEGRVALLRSARPPARWRGASSPSTPKKRPRSVPPAQRCPLRDGWLRPQKQGRRRGSWIAPTSPLTSRWASPISSTHGTLAARRICAASACVTPLSLCSTSSTAVSASASATRPFTTSPSPSPTSVCTTRASGPGRLTRPRIPLE